MVAQISLGILRLKKNFSIPTKNNLAMLTAITFAATLNQANFSAREH